MNITRNHMLRTLSILLGLLALITILPYGGAKEPSILGYKSLCPFSPFSTLITLYIALTLHRYLGNSKPETP